MGTSETPCACDATAEAFERNGGDYARCPACKREWRDIFGRAPTVRGTDETNPPHGAPGTPGATGPKMCANDPTHVCRCGEVAPPEEGGGHYDCPGAPGTPGATGPSTVGYDTARELAAYVDGKIASGAWPAPGSAAHVAEYVDGRTAVLAEAVLADAVRTDPPRLPTDSAERKRTPLCTGLIDYFPSALEKLVDYIAGVGCGVRAEPAEDLLLALRDRQWGEVCVMALCDLDAELAAGPDECGDLNTVMSLSDLFTEFAGPLAAVAQVSWYGNEKHNPGQPLHHARDKSTDHPDCIARHHVEIGGFDGPMRHSACKLWRALAGWQLDLEQRGAPMARGAQGAIAGLERLDRFWHAQAEWSQRTFGVDVARGPVGALRHLQKECDEAIADPNDVVEFADCLIMLLDATRRAGHSLAYLMSAAERKAENTRGRSWPAPPAVDDGKPLEHVEAVP